MRLNINKRIVKAGTVIEVSWNSEEGNEPRLLLQSGNQTARLSVPISGSKKFKIKGNSGPHSVTLISNVYGKERSIKKRLFVYGKKRETDDFEYVDRGSSSPLNQWNNRFGAWWSSFTPEKKRLYILLLVLIGYQALNAIPEAALYAHYLMYGIIFYLFWKVMK